MPPPLPAHSAYNGIDSMRLSSFTNGRDNNFNIIRILAALAVLISHSFPLSGFGEDPLTSLTRKSAGQMAVDIFFVTSGFLVSASLLNRKSAVEYLCARGLRIFPGLWVMVAVMVLVLGPAFTDVPLASYFTSPVTYKYICRNSALIAGTTYALPGVFEHNPYTGSVNGSLWTLPYEIRMYLILAAIWVGLQMAPQKRPMLFKLAILTITAISGVSHLVGTLYFSTGIGFAELCFMFFSGASYYVLKDRVNLSWGLFWALAAALGFSMLNIKLFVVAYNFFLPYLILFLAYVPGGLIRIYNRLGDYSYGLYIYAFPVQQSVAALFPGIAWWWMVLIATPVALVLAVVSWHFLEKRALELKSSLVTRARRMVDWSTAPVLGKN
jgi:peptidoglycan/LPS O-acetylase OafA/YrhL